mmetsp:Transcript_909/g.3337  ORF Transcript_909/g.3337 Transcript_909/m.3337 type:complete len:206 (-) Transcript_909:20-637(-)
MSVTNHVALSLGLNPCAAYASKYAPANASAFCLPIPRASSSSQDPSDIVGKSHEHQAKSGIQPTTLATVHLKFKSPPSSSSFSANDADADARASPISRRRAVSTDPDCAIANTNTLPNTPSTNVFPTSIVPRASTPRTRLGTRARAHHPPRATLARIDDDVVAVRDVVVTVDAMDATIRTPRRQSARSTPRASRTVGHRRHDIDG